MSNIKASTIVSHFIIDVSDEQAVIKSLNRILEVDNDLTENDDYFQDDTLELGYESEADRIVKEYIKEHGIPKTTEQYEETFSKISDRITRQEFFGEHSLNFLKVGDTILSVSFMIGGQ